MTDKISAIKASYGAVARSGLSSESTGISTVAKAFGYSEEQLASIPAQANLGLSCGNPVVMASLSAGETVVDLGSGGGLDVFLAAAKVGENGRAIGIDMTEEMVTLARQNAAKSALSNTEFHHAPIENMPLATESVDCIISNCVLNLVTDKAAALAEIFRVLKPGGRLAISDIALRKTLPAAMQEDISGWVSCISGAMLVADNRQKLVAAGFLEIEIIDDHADLNIYKAAGGSGCCGSEQTLEGQQAAQGCCAPPEQDNTYHENMADLIDTLDFNEYALSVKMFAVKPLSSH